MNISSFLELGCFLKTGLWPSSRLQAEADLDRRCTVDVAASDVNRAGLEQILTKYRQDQIDLAQLRQEEYRRLEQKLRQRLMQTRGEEDSEAEEENATAAKVREREIQENGRT